MEQYISKDALVAEINRQQRKLCLLGQSYEVELRKSAAIQNGVYCSLISFLDTLEVKEIDLEKEYDNEFFKDAVFCKLVNRNAGISIAKHFFELGMRVNNPITAADKGTAEEIIINLKRVEQDYHIDLTKEIEWVRNKAQKGE